ncbi:MAG TPA: ABC transporter substrate-binding protein [Solirubrobacter sp.]|nr:ABC transporter substrate-binding protein [Solirubrobacter sp.]
MRFVKTTGAAAFAAALAAAVVACGSSGSAGSAGSGAASTESATAVATESEGTPKDGGSLTFALNAGWDTLDPAVSAFTFARQIMLFMFDPLLRHDPKTGKIVPGLAKSYDVSADGKTITLELPPGVKFHDGTDCDADAVVASLERVTDPDLKSPWASLLAPVDRISADGATTIKITLKGPSAPFLDALTQVNLAPVSPTAVKQEGKDFGAHPVGTGPFKFSEQTAGQSVTVVRNPDYAWPAPFHDATGPAHLDKITVRDVAEDATRMSLLKTGEIDIAYQALASQLSALKANPKFRVLLAPRSGMPRSLVLNTKLFPFSDPKLREAITYAIDKQQIVDTAWGGAGSVAGSVLTPGMPGFSSAVAEAAPKRDVAKAKQILAAAGWTPGSGGVLTKDGKKLSFSFVTQPGTTFQLEGQLLQAQLKEVGIDLKIASKEQAAVLADLQGGKAPFTDMLFAATDPDVMYTVLATDSIGKAWNGASYSNPEMDDLLTRARTEIDPDKRAALYEQAQKIVARDNPYVPFYNISVPYATTARVHGLEFDGQAFWDGYSAWVD